MNDRYVCLRCGYTYDPVRGDAKGGIKPGTPGDRLPPDWRCPVCRAGQCDFARRDDEEGGVP
jgi:rubredoxin